MKRSVLSIAVFGALLASTTAFAQSQQITRLWTYNAWQGLLFRHANGYFDRCGTVVHYASGTTLGFAITQDANLSLKITNLSWNLTPGQQAGVTMMIDGRYFPTDELGRPVGIMAKISQPNQIEVDFGYEYKRIQNLRRGHVLTVSGPAGTEQFSLKDSSVAFRRMTTCIPVRQVRTVQDVSPLPQNIQIDLDPNMSLGGLAVDDAFRHFEEFRDIAIEDDPLAK